MGLDQNYLHSILGRNLQKFQVIPIHPWFVHPISRTPPPGRSRLQEHGAKLQREELESRARESHLTSRVVWRVGRPLHLMGLGARAENKDSIWLSELAALYRGSSRFRFRKATAKSFKNFLDLWSAAVWFTITGSTWEDTLLSCLTQIPSTEGMGDYHNWYPA